MDAMALNDGTGPGRLVVREARQEDRDAVLAFCAQTWDGGDYIEQVWDRWLADADGALLLGEAGGEPVALSHIQMLAAGEAWIEGVRVAPRARRQGVGRVMISRSLVRARDLGATVARLFTGARNQPAQRLFGAFGFSRVAELVCYSAGALAPDGERAGPEPRTAAERDPTIAETTRDTTTGALPPHARLRTPGPAEFETLWAWLTQSNLTPFNGGLEVRNWAARGLSEPALREYLAAGEVITLDEWGGPQALAVATEDVGDGAPYLEARYVDGLSDAIGRLALLLRGEAHRRGLGQVFLWLPDLLILTDAMNGAGYTPENDTPMWVYARSL